MLLTLKHSFFALAVHLRRSYRRILKLHVIVSSATMMALSPCALSQQSPQQRETVEQQQKNQQDVKRSAENPMPSTAQANASHNANCGNCEPEKNWWEKLRTDPVATFTGLLVIVTGVLIYTAVRQETMARKHERAYVFGNPKLARTETIREDDGARVVSVYRLCVENFGRTPASVKNVQWKLLVRKDLPESPVYGEGTFVHHILHPNQGKEFTKAPSINYRFDWTEPRVIYGRVIYEDVFKDEHRSGFLFLIEKNADDRRFQHFALSDERFSKYYYWD